MTLNEIAPNRPLAKQASDSCWKSSTNNFCHPGLQMGLQTIQNTSVALQMRKPYLPMLGFRNPSKGEVALKQDTEVVHDRKGLQSSNTILRDEHPEPSHQVSLHAHVAFHKKKKLSKKSATLMSTPQIRNENYKLDETLDHRCSQSSQNQQIFQKPRSFFESVADPEERLAAVRSRANFARGGSFP